MKTQILALAAAATVAAFGSAASADQILSSNISDARALHAAGIAKPLESATLRNGAEVKSVAKGERMLVITQDPTTNENFISSNTTTVRVQNTGHVDVISDALRGAR